MPSAYKRFLHRSFFSLDEFVTQLADVLSCPVTIENLNHELMAYSKHNEDADAARISTIIARKVPDHLIQLFWKEGVMTALHASPEPVVIDNMRDAGLGPRVALSIRNQKEVVIGYIWISEAERSLTMYEKGWLKRVATKAASLLQKGLHARQHDVNEAEKLWRLLTGTFSEHDIPPQVQTDHIQSCILLVDFLEEKEIPPFQRLLSERKFSVIIDDCRVIVLLCGRDVVKEAKALIRTLPQSCRYACGNATDDALGLSRSYEQALQFIILKDRFPIELEECVFYYESGPLRYIPAYEEKARTTDTHPALSTLFAYDNVHQTNLFLTLAIYVQQDGHITKTAKKLHIHPNSLQYRLKRITELTGVQLKAPLERAGLLLDLQQKTWTHLWKTHK